MMLNKGYLKKYVNIYINNLYIINKIIYIFINFGFYFVKH